MINTRAVVDGRRRIGETQVGLEAEVEVAHPPPPGVGVQEPVVKRKIGNPTRKF